MNLNNRIKENIELTTFVWELTTICDKATRNEQETNGK